MKEGERRLSKFLIDLCQWRPNDGCVMKPEKMYQAWVRLVGLLVHFWEMKILKKLGDACGGFLDADKGTRVRSNMLWARILV